MYKSIIAVICLAALVTIGCAALEDRNMAAAKIIARNAGYYIALNNPGAADAVNVAYATMEQYSGESYKASVLSGFKWLLDQKNVKGSDKLAADAMDLMAIFGLPVPKPVDMDLAWVNQFDEGQIRELADAFLQGMNQ